MVFLKQVSNDIHNIHFDNTEIEINYGGRVLRGNLALHILPKRLVICKK